MDLTDILKERYSKKKPPSHFRNGPLNDGVSEHLQKMGVIGSVSWTENGRVVTEYFYEDDDTPR